MKYPCGVKVSKELALLMRPHLRVLFCNGEAGSAARKNLIVNQRSYVHSYYNWDFRLGLRNWICDGLLTRGSSILHLPSRRRHRRPFHWVLAHLHTKHTRISGGRHCLELLIHHGRARTGYQQVLNVTTLWSRTCSITNAKARVNAISKSQVSGMVPTRAGDHALGQ